MYEENFVGRISQLFNESGLSVNEFAHKVGLSRQTMDFYLNGKRSPSAESLKNISEAFSVTTDWLLALTEVRSKSSDIQNAVSALGITERATEKISMLTNKGKECLSLLIEVSTFDELMIALIDYCKSLEFYPADLKINSILNHEKDFQVADYHDDGSITLKKEAATEFHELVLQKRFMDLCSDIWMSYAALDELREIEKNGGMNNHVD